MTTKLRSLVREANDPWITMYVINNLKPGSCSTYTLRYEFQEDLFRSYGKPSTDKRALLRAADTKVMMQAFMKASVDNWKKSEALRTEMTAALEAHFRTLRSETHFDQVMHLKDEEPLTRWLAVQVLQERWAPVERHFIDLLEDKAPQVREAAHQSLIKLSRGADFGPAGASPSAEQIQAAQRGWRAWLALQDREK